jgi:ATP-binding cassette subfamily F protein 3
VSSALLQLAVTPAKDERLKDREEQKRLKREDDRRLKLLNEIEKKIAQTESLIAALEEQMGEPGFFDDPERGKTGGERHAALNLQLEELYGEWERLSV